MRKLMTKKLEENGDMIGRYEFKPEFILSATLIGSLTGSYSALAIVLESGHIYVLPGSRWDTSLV